jgi:hypothetical protein
MSKIPTKIIKAISKILTSHPESNKSQRRKKIRTTEKIAIVPSRLLLESTENIVEMITASRRILSRRVIGVLGNLLELMILQTHHPEINNKNDMDIISETAGRDLFESIRVINNIIAVTNIVRRNNLTLVVDFKLVFIINLRPFNLTS